MAQAMDRELSSFLLLILCREYDPDLSDAIIDSVSKYLHSVTSGNVSARIISGQEEGGAAWITVNYLNGTFHQTYVSYM